MKTFSKNIRGVVWDWGDTLMRDIPGYPGSMAGWPEVEAMPGAASALKAMSGLSVQCVATNATESSGEDVAKALARVGLRDHLSHFFTSKGLGVSKPDPNFFQAVARKLGIPASGLISIGNDLRKDIAPAKAAGMTTVWVSSRGQPDSLGVADLVVLDLVDLVGRFPELKGSCFEP